MVRKYESSIPAGMELYKECLNCFLQSANLRKYSDGHIEYTTKTWVDFTTWLSLAHGQNVPDAETLAPGILEAWLSNRDMKLSTVKSKMSKVLLVFRLAYRQGILKTYPPIIGAKVPRPERKSVDVLSAAEIRLIKDYIYSLPSTRPDVLRDRVIFQMLITGIRISEIVKLKWTDVSESSFRITAKGGKLRHIPLTDHLHQALAAWSKVSPGKTEYVFRVRSHRGPDSPPVYQTLYTSFSRWFNGCGIERENFKGGHLWRHSLATLIFEDCRDIETVRQFLGHEDQRITWSYIHIATPVLEETLHIIDNKIHGIQEAVSREDFSRDLYRGKK